MCGIAGILKSDRKEYHTQNIERMLSTLLHRGPDGWGTYVARDLALGHTRLSIMDIEGAHQPMASSKYVLVYNGEIFNYSKVAKGSSLRLTLLCFSSTFSS
jgi:asparagine synthase (glutamine-hydrolysing)